MPVQKVVTIGNGVGRRPRGVPLRAVFSNPKRKEVYEQLYPEAKPEIQRLKGITNLKQFATGAAAAAAPVDVKRLQQNDIYQWRNYFATGRYRTT